MDRYILSHTIIFCIIFFSSCHTPDYKSEDTLIPPLDEQISDCIWDVDSNSNSGENTGEWLDVGDIIPSEFLLQEFNYCYPPDSLGSSFSFSTHPNKVFMIEFSASW